MPWGLHTSRLEIRDSEGHMSEWTIRHKYALTSLALRLIEHDAFPERLYVAEDRIKNLVLAIADDPTAPISFQDDLVMTPMEHQLAIYTAAMEYFDRHHLPSYETDSYHSFAHLCRAFTEVGMHDSYVTPISDRIDWAAKLEHMRLSGLADTDINGLSFRALEYDLKWENVDRNGPARRWYHKYGNEHASQKDIDRHWYQPPVTRAMARVALMIDMLPNAEYQDKSWDQLIVNNYRVDMPNPGETTYTL